MTRSAEPTANLSPFGDHLHTVAALLIRKSTKVGLNSRASSFHCHTKAFLSWEQVKIFEPSGEMSTEVTVLSWPFKTVMRVGFLEEPGEFWYNSTVLSFVTAKTSKFGEKQWSLMGSWPNWKTTGADIWTYRSALNCNGEDSWYFVSTLLALISYRPVHLRGGAFAIVIGLLNTKKQR